MWGERVAAGIVVLFLAACTAPAPRLAELDRLPVVQIPEGATAPEEPAEPVRATISSSSEKLPPSIVAGVKEVAGVLRVGARRSGMISLAELVGAEHPIPRRPAGTVLPISVEAHDADLVAAFPRLAAEAAALRAGDAVVPRSQAEFRGLEVGDGIVVSNGARVRLRIGAVTDDDRVFRSELILPMAVADRLRLERSRSIIMAVDPEAASAVEVALERLVGEFPARVRVPTSGGGLSSFPGRGLLSLAGVKMTFGEFWYRPLAGIAIAVDPTWRRANIAEQRVPLLGTVTCHRKILPLLTAAMNEVRALGLSRLIKSFSGCYSPRMQVSDDGELSRHAFGIAVDINAGANPYGATPTQDLRLVRIMERWGFSWGGRWSVPDGMHFEFSAFPT
jgi:hypothetical protein